MNRFSCPDPDAWPALLEEEADEHTGWCRHLEICERCQRVLQDLPASPTWRHVAATLGENPQDTLIEPRLRQVIDQLKLEAGTGAEPTTPAEIALDFLRPADRPDLLGHLGSYEVREVIGRGGMGVVLKAFDPNLQRVVAIKVLAPELSGNAIARKRFVREARAAAAVLNDNIITIHAVEDAGGLPYLVMQYVAGTSLQEKLDQEGPLPVTEIVRIGQQAAAGLAAAHGQGLIHRDIKPANILLENGVERVKLTDFGLARAVDDAACTQQGYIVGTPLYMAPEQARGEAVDPRADLFSLGCVLYTLATGEPPFQAGSTMEVLRRVNEDSPRAIRPQNPNIPEWLERVILRLLAKNPAERFDSAAAVSKLLSQCLAHLEQPRTVPLPSFAVSPSTAPSQSATHYRGRWLLAAGLLLAICLGVSEGTGFTNFVDSLAVALRLRTPDGMLVVELDDPQIKVLIDGTDVVITGAGVQEFRLKAATYRLTASKQGRAVKTQLVTLHHGAKGVVRISLEPETAQALVPAGKVADKRAVPTEGKVFDQPVAMWGVPEANPACGVFSRDGKILATGFWSGSLVLWDIPSGRKRSVQRTPLFDMRTIAITPDGQTLATGTGDGVVRLWDVESGKLMHELTGHVGRVMGVAFSPDGTTLASVGGEENRPGQLRFWDVKTAKPGLLIPAFDMTVWCVAYAPDGKSVAVGMGRGTEGKAVIVSTADGQALRTFDVPAAVRPVAFAPDGQRLAVGYRVGEFVKILDLVGGNELASFPAKKGLFTLTFAHEGKRLLTAGGDGSVVLWDLEGNKVRRFATFLGHQDAAFFAAISPDGRTLASGDRGRFIRLWDISSLLPRGP